MTFRQAEGEEDEEEDEVRIQSNSSPSSYAHLLRDTEILRGFLLPSNRSGFKCAVPAINISVEKKFMLKSAGGR
jgi:hypothetical protein